MVTGWNNGNTWFNPNNRNEQSSFAEHTERMRKFQDSHAGVTLVNGSRLDESALLGRMEPLLVRGPLIETGGIRLPKGVVYWSPLVSVAKVAQYRLSQN